MEITSPHPGTSRRDWAILGLILLLATVLRLWHIDAAPFWLDEHLTVELSNGHGLAHLDLPKDQVISPVPDYISLSAARPWWEIWKNSSEDVHPPLFYMVLRVWRELFGESDATIRGLSTVLSLLSILALYSAIKTQAGPTPALWASLLMAVAAAQIEFAQETRSYMLLQASLLGAGAVLLRIERDGPTKLSAGLLAILFLTAALTHLLALPLLGAMGLYALIRLRGNTRLWALGAMVLGIAIAAALWGPFAMAQSSGYLSRTSFVHDSDWSLGSWAFRMADLPLRYFVSAPARSTTIASMGLALYILPLLLLRDRPMLLLWWMWLAIGVFSVAAADLARHGQMMEYLRYTLAVSPAAYAIASLMLAHLTGWFRHIIPMLLSIACLGAIQGAYIRQNPEWRSFCGMISERVGDNDIVVLYDPKPDPWLARCTVVGMQYYARHKPHVIALLDGVPPPAVAERIRDSQEVWVFTLGGMGAAVGWMFPGCRIAEYKHFDTIGSLIRVEPNRPAATSQAGSPDEPATGVPSDGPGRPIRP